MKIAWCTPLSRRSGISKFSLAVVQALAPLAQVDIWCTKADDDFPVDFAAVHELGEDEATLALLREYDAVVYNLGNSIHHHEVIYRVACRVRGTAIVHDKYMHHFFASYYLEKLKSLPKYALTMRHYYGDYGKNLALRTLWSGRLLWETEEIVRYPLFEPGLWNANAVIVHSHEALMRLAPKLGMVPVKRLHHPFYLYDYEYGDKPLLSRRELGLPEDKQVLLTLGFLNANKRVDTVIKVLAAHPELRNRVVYVVAGGWVSQTNVDYLKDLAKAQGVSDLVRFAGYLDDHTMHSYLATADIGLNLRYPSIESSSGSLIEQLYFRKPVIVTRIAAFDELPDECVVKVGMDDEAGNLERGLLRLLDDAEFRDATARAGHAWAQKNCQGGRYASEFVSFLASLRSHAALDFVDGISDQLSAFLHPGLHEEYSASLAADIGEILD